MLTCVRKSHTVSSYIRHFGCEYIIHMQIQSTRDFDLALMKFRSKWQILTLRLKSDQIQEDFGDIKHEICDCNQHTNVNTKTNIYMKGLPLRFSNRMDTRVVGSLWHVYLTKQMLRFWPYFKEVHTASHQFMNYLPLWWEIPCFVVSRTEVFGIPNTRQFCGRDIPI